MSVERLNKFRTRYKALRVLAPEVKNDSQCSHIVFHFKIDDIYSFQTRYEVPLPINEADPVIKTLLGYLAIVESFSYWKLMCPSRIEVETCFLDEKEISFFTDLLHKGMSEFLYRNALPLDIDVSFISLVEHIAAGAPFQLRSKPASGYLVLIGGGKDSIVTLELIKSYAEKIKDYYCGFSLNPIQASLDTLSVAKISESVIATRVIDVQMKNLNNEGFFNGHIPFSAVLSFIASIVAYVKGLGTVLVSNESSANQANVVIEGVHVNHQYSKSIEFESALRKLFSYKNIPITYVSFLRPLSEVQISKIFSSLTEYHGIFQSCNVRQTMIERERRTSTSELSARDRWCGTCPKCVFVYIMLRPFLEPVELNSIFGRNIEKEPEYIKLAKALSGESDLKPFECVGTFEEVRFAINVVGENTHEREKSIWRYIQNFDEKHFLEPELFTYLKERVLE